MTEYESLLGPLKDQLAGEIVLWAGGIEVKIPAPTETSWMRARAALTPTRFIWSLYGKPEYILSINFSEVFSFNHDEWDDHLFHFETKPSNYPKELLKYNPEGIVELSFMTFDGSIIPVLEMCLEVPSMPLITKTDNSSAPENSMSSPMKVNGELDKSSLSSTESLEVVQALEQSISKILTSGEKVITAVEATWKDQADRSGPGFFQGALIGTDKILHFLYSSEPRARFADVHEHASIPLSDIHRSGKERTYLTMQNGYRFKAPRPNSHHLALDVRGVGKLSFVVRPNRFDEILKFLKNAR
jgi:hypothetical protein